MRHVLLSAVLVGFLAASSQTPCGADDKPAPGVGPAAAASYVGKIVFLKKLDTHLSVLQDNGEKTDLGVLNQIHYEVLADNGQQLKVRHRGKDGWFAKAEALPAEEAVKYFTEQLKANPLDSTTLQKRGAAWMLRGELDSALKDLDEAIRLEPKGADLWHFRGQIWSKKDLDKAIRDYTEAIRLNPKDTEAILDRGSAWSAKKDYDKAMADYDEVLRLDPMHVIALNNRANRWLEVKEFDKALKDLDEAVRLDPQHYGPFYNRGNAWSQKKEYNKAIQDYTEAIRLNPKFFSAINNRGNMWMRMKEYNKALLDFDRIIRLDPKQPLPYYNKACCYALQKQTDVALDYLKQSLERGYRNFKHMEKDTDLDSIRNEPRYKKLVEEFDK